MTLILRTCVFWIFLPERGALGLEALSRGAAYAVFVDNSISARAVVHENIEELGLTGVTKVYRRDATRLGAPGNLEQFDLVFADPPYGEGLGEAAIVIGTL